MLTVYIRKVWRWELKDVRKKSDRVLKSRNVKTSRITDRSLGVRGFVYIGRGPRVAACSVVFGGLRVFLCLCACVSRVPDGGPECLEERTTERRGKSDTREREREGW